jgi:hypothetical protein
MTHLTYARQDRFLERLAAARYRLLDAISGIDPELLCTEAVEGMWTVKDIFAHIVSWNGEFRACIRSILLDHHPGYERFISAEEDFAGWNEDVVARKRDWTWDQVLASAERDYQEAVELILRLQPVDLRKRGVTPWKQAALDRPAAPTNDDTETIETLVTYHWRHMNQHAHTIERWWKARALRIRRAPRAS